jgi:hypothetical protein
MIQDVGQIFQRGPIFLRNLLKRADVLFDHGPQIAFGNLQLVSCLQVEPELGCGAEVNAQTQGGIRGDIATAVDDVADPSHRHVDVPRQLILADVQRLHELLLENLAWRNWIEFLIHDLFSL